MKSIQRILCLLCNRQVGVIDGKFAPHKVHKGKVGSKSCPKSRQAVK